MTRTPEERAAMEWLDRQLRDPWDSNDLPHLLTLKRMLGAPRLPDVNDHAAIDAVQAHLVAKGWHLGRGQISAVVMALREPPKPATKEVEVERWFVASADMGHLYGYVSEGGARDDVHAWDVARPKDGPHFAIRLTGTATVRA